MHAYIFSRVSRIRMGALWRKGWKVLGPRSCVIRGFAVEHQSFSVREKKDGITELNLAPADSLWTTARDGAVRLRMEVAGPASEPPVTTISMFQDAVQSFGNRPAMAVKRDGQWQTTTYFQYYRQCWAAAKSFLKLGLERFHGVGILGFNSPEWFIADIGAIMAGGFPVGIYNTSSSDACLYVAKNSASNILVVEDHQQLEKILQIEEQLPHLKAIVQYRHELKEKRPNLYTWEEFMRIGSDVPDSIVDDIIASQKANQCCMMAYTSGTTGAPKAVMLSHDNITWLVKMYGKDTGMQEQEIGVSYLPLSHVAPQFFDLWMPMCFGGTTYFAKPDALKGSLVDTLKEVRPTQFFGVPRIWEKIKATLETTISSSSFVQKPVSAWEHGTGPAARLSHVNGTSSQPWGSPLADSLVLKKLHANVGLDRCLRCQTSSAPILKDTLEYFSALNLPILEVYGLSESSGPHTVSIPSDFRLTSCGKTVSGCKTKIYMPDKNGNGEICYGGRDVFMGYLNMAEKTIEALDEEGWLHTGDIGKFDQDGFLYITGRIKEIVITAGGENIPPVPIEDRLKKEVPIISNCMLIGDKRKFLSMLITLKCTIDPITLEPKDELTPEAIKFCQQLGSQSTRVSEVVCSKDPLIYKAIQEGLDRVNHRAVSRAQKVQKWIILEKDFTQEGGELGPTMKLKRPAILSMYEKVINELYKQ
ncbi:long-chain-fatty-acid--CoA ligase ACSBG2-like isoform X2 [Ambystoma mexicanum]|uniref:long-chain-fatty-acid--CoA ligase ACSBG2-like isoform X2 n=1 Tax=Ambystoma mexicanum TaxID=8296 RepID=UPI0037E91C15